MAFDLFNFLKIPDFLKIPSSGIDISDSCIRFVNLKDKGNSFSLEKFGEISIPDGVFSGGQILNKESLSTLLSSIREKFDLGFVKVSIPEEKSYIFNTEIPKVSDREMRSVVEFSLEEFVPLKPDEASFEFMPIRELSNGNIEVSVSVVPKQVISDYVEVFKKAGLEIISFCNESRKIARALIRDDDPETYMVVNIKDKSTILSMIEKGMVTYTSTVSVGTDALVGKIKDAGLSVKGAGCFKLPESAFSEKEEETSEYLYILANIFSVIRDEIIRFSEFYRSKSGNRDSENKIKKILLSGRTSLVPGFSRYIASSIDAEVEVGNVWTNVFSLEDHIPQINFSDSLDFAASIGISLPEDHIIKK